MMKKIIKLFFIFFIAISITACANEEDKTLSMKWGKENKFDGLISYELVVLSRLHQIH